MLHNRPADAPARRPAFTLIELLVVLAIILVLASLVLGAILGLVGTQQQAVTEDTFRTVETKLRQHWDFVLKQARDEARQGRAKITPGVYLLAGDGTTNQYIEKRAQVIHIKLRLLQAFPETFREITNPPYLNVTIGSSTYNLLPDTRYTATYQSTLKNLVPGNHNATTESSACLLMALKISRNSTSLNDDDLPGRILDTDQDGIKEIVDSWGTPLRFKRFVGNAPVAAEVDAIRSPPKLSTVYKDPNNKTQPLKQNDLLDPEGTLGENGWYNSSQTKPMRVIVEGLFGTITGNYSVPYVQSAGPGKILDDSDDLYSFRLRLGGHGD